MTTSIDPTTTATQLATASIQAAQSVLDDRSKTAQTVSSGLTSLQTALRTFDSALVGLSGKQGIRQYTAALSSAGVGTVSAASSAQPGSYSLFVEQVASANQVAWQNLDAAAATPSGTLTVRLAGGASFDVAFAGADTDGDGKLSTSEIARAINSASGNAGQVNAALVTVNGQSQLVLTAAATGAASKISLDTTALPAGALKTALGAPALQMVNGQDAIVWMGAQGSGLKMQQASNTFTAIPGVTMNVTQAQATGSAPLTLTVASDDSGTAANVNTFVAAYNALNKSLGDLTALGDPANGKAAAAFASDAGVRALRDSLGNQIRQQVGGLRLLDFGISFDRDGTLQLDQTKLQKGLAAHPDGLETVFGKTGITTSSGVLGSLDKYMQGWLNSTNGLIAQRQASVQRQQKTISDSQANLNDQYSRAYDRYLKQFTQLQQLQSQMDQTSGMFASLSGS
jgi:flagellar hook-associated protein 2